MSAPDLGKIFLDLAIAFSVLAFLIFWDYHEWRKRKRKLTKCLCERHQC